MSRMTLSKAITRRLLNGDVRVINEGDRHFIAYNRIAVQLVGGRIVMDLCADKVVLASVDVEFHPNGTVHVEGLEGRMELLYEPHFEPRFEYGAW